MPDENIAVEYDPLFHVSPSLLDDAWEPAFRLLKKAMDRLGIWMYYSEEDLYKLVADKDMQLWIAVVDGKLVAAFLTQLIEYPQRTVFDVMIVGGDKLEDWVKPAWATFKSYARSYECQGIRGFGRAGWVKLLEEDTIDYSVTWDVNL